MKPTTSCNGYNLPTWLLAQMATPDSPVEFAECFTFIANPNSSSAVAYTWTNVDYPVVYPQPGGPTFNCTGPLVQGLKYKGACGLEVDKQQVTIAARPTDLINGAPFLFALRDGAFDGAAVYRDRVFLTAPAGTVVGGVRMFQGRISTVDSVGRTQATVTVASDLVILDYDMPRNLFSPTCNHTLYDSGCGVIAGTYSVSATAGLGSSQNQIFFGGTVPVQSGLAAATGAAGYAQGALGFTSGANAGVQATIKAVITDPTHGQGLQLMYPLPFVPAVGDGVNIAFGCDHTQTTCQNKFNNLANFRGFPYVPPPELAY